VAFAPDGALWAAGSDGRVDRLLRASSTR